MHIELSSRPNGVKQAKGRTFPRRLAIGSAMLLYISSGAIAAQERTAEPTTPVSVRDTITMTKLGIEDALSDDNQRLDDKGLIAHFSPDGTRFFLVLKRGDLEHNCMVYSLLVFVASSPSERSQFTPLLEFRSASNQEGIRNPKWLEDSVTISFIGESEHELPQVYTFNIQSKRLTKLSNHDTAVRDYDLSVDGRVLVFEAARRGQSDAGKGAAGSGDTVVVSRQSLVELVTTGCMPQPEPWEKELFVKTVDGPEQAVEVHDRVLEGVPLSVSPDGRHVLFGAFVREIPEEWLGYQDDLLRPYLRAKRRPGEASRIAEYFVLDIQRQSVRPLLGTPWSFRGNDRFAWAPDGTSVVVSGAYLPLKGSSTETSDARSKQTYVVEVNLRDGRPEVITGKPLHVLSWNRKTNKVLFREGWRADAPLIAFAKTGSSWRESDATDTESSRKIRVSMEEDMNTPPKLFVTDLQTNRKTLLLDLNPQFGKRNFGREEAVTWKASDGHEVSGGLYLPPNYAPGQRYPLVIQTHGFSANKFWIDGPWSSAFAAQPLAGKGFVVLQVGHSVDRSDDDKFLDTPQEAPRQMAAYEGAIDYLDSRGLIDRSQVGIIGFSRTVYYVAFTLTHSKYHFAAATLADGVDGGYFVYRALPDIAPDFDSINGGVPAGQTMSLWVRNAPGFNLDKVETPVRQEAYGPGSLFLAWDWFSGLSTLGKPVDLIYLPTATHLLVKPADRLASQQGNVDWFLFWLKGEEDSDPAKSEQYARWRELRKLKENRATAEHAGSQAVEYRTLF